MPAIKANDPNALKCKLARQAYEQGDYARCVDYLSGLSSGVPPGLRAMAAEAGYKQALTLCARGEYLPAIAAIQFASRFTSDATFRKLCEDRYQLLRSAGRVSHIDKSQCPLCSENPAVRRAFWFDPGTLAPELDGVYCIGAYRSGFDPQRSNPFSKLLREMKKPDHRKSVEAMGNLLAHFVNEHVDVAVRLEVDWLLPVPTVPDRATARGYRIPEILSGIISQQTCIPSYPDAVRLERATADLRNLGAAERRRELKDAFVIARRDLVENRSIMIIDDITTHGTTLKEIAGVLRDAMASKVSGLVLAHTESSWI